MRRKGPEAMDEKSFGTILRNLFLMALISYIVPVVLIGGGLVGAGIGIGYLIWGR